MADIGLDINHYNSDVRKRSPDLRQSQCNVTGSISVCFHETELIDTE